MTRKDKSIKTKNEDILEELTHLKESFERHVLEDVKQFAEINENLAKLNVNVEELLGILKAFTLGKSMFMGISIFVGSIVGFIVGLRQIIAWLK